MKYWRKFINCKWGPMFLIRDSNGEFNGQSSPVWINAAPVCFMIQAGLGGILFAILLMAYVFIIGDLHEDCGQNLKPLIISMFTMILISALLDFYIYQVKYATDQRWFQLMILVGVQIFLYMIVCGVSLFFVLQALFKEEDFKCSSGNAFNSQIWIATISVSIATSILLLSKLLSLCLMIHKYLIKTRDYMAIATLPKKTENEQ